jgi:hypothetical protein
MSDLHGEERLLAHFKASTGGHWIVLKWKKRDDGPVRIAVVRSDQGFADKAEEVVENDSGQRLIYEGTDDYCQDQDVIDGVRYYYTCFARREDGIWERQHTYHVKCRVPHEHERHEVFDPDSPAFLRSMDRMRAGFWLGSMNRPG